MIAQCQWNNVDEYVEWIKFIHKNLQYDHNNTSHNETNDIFYGIYYIQGKS